MQQRILFESPSAIHLTNLLEASLRAHELEALLLPKFAPSHVIYMAHSSLVTNQIAKKVRQTFTQLPLRGQRWLCSLI